MAPDRSDGFEGGQYPSPESLAVLRAALSGYLADRNEMPVCEALAVLAREAHDRRLFSERMLVAFKRAWGEMPEVRSLPDEKERQRLLERLVRLCIDAFYAR